MQDRCALALLVALTTAVGPVACGRTAPEQIPKPRPAASENLEVEETTPAEAPDTPSPAPAPKPELVVPKGHRGAVRAIAFTADGTLAATGGEDGRVKLWDVAARRVWRTCTGHLGGVHTVAFTPDGGRLVSAGFDSQVRLWNVHDGAMLQRFDHAQENPLATLSPDGTRLVTGGRGEPLRLWEVDTGKELRQWQTYVSALAYMPDGQRVLVAEFEFAHGRGSDGWAGSKLALLDVRRPDPPEDLFGSEWRTTIRQLVVTPDGKQAASADEDKRVRLWDLDKRGEPRVLGAQHSNFPTVAVSPQGRQLAVSSELGVTLYALPTGAPGTGYGKFARVAAFAPPTGQRLLVATHELRLWDLAVGEPPGEAWPRSLEGLSGIATAWEARKIVVVTTERRLLVWDLAGGTLDKQLELAVGADLLAVSADARRAVVGDDAVALVDLTTGAELWRKESDGNKVRDADISSDGRLVAIARFQGVELLDAASGKPTKRAPRVTAPDAVAFSPAGSSIVVGAQKPALSHWSTSGKQLWKVVERPYDVDSLSYTARGWVAVGRYYPMFSVWQLDTGQRAPTRELKPGAPNRHGVTVSLSSDHQLLLGAANGLLPTLFRVDTGAELRRLAWRGMVPRRAFTPGGRFVVTVEPHAGVVLWSTRTAEQVARLVVLPDKQWAILTPEPKYKGSAGAEAHLGARLGRRATPLGEHRTSFHDPAAVAAAVGRVLADVKPRGE